MSYSRLGLHAGPHSEGLIESEVLGAEGEVLIGLSTCSANTAILILAIISRLFAGYGGGLTISGRVPSRERRKRKKKREQKRDGMRIEKGRDWERVRDLEREVKSCKEKRIRTEEAEKKQKSEEQEFRRLAALSIRTLVYYVPWSSA